MTWGVDNEADRLTGESVEAEARKHFEAHGARVTDHPFGIKGPDFLVEGRRPRLVEVRSKYPDRKDRYGLECPKDVLWVAADIVYLIKDSHRKGWYFANMRDLPEGEGGMPGSYRSGQFDQQIPNHYWPCSYWEKLPWPYTERKRGQT